jgi:hypothetical protein
VSLSVTIYAAKPADVKCGHCGSVIKALQELWFGNLPFNSIPRIVGVYDAVCAAEGKRAGDLVPVLERILVDAERNAPQRRIVHTPYEIALEFLKELSTVCKSYPDGIVRVSK